MNRIYKLFWLALIGKLLLTVFLPVTADESYYWVWAQKLKLSYYDHPPFISWIYWLGSQIDFYGGMVRWPGVILLHASFLIWLKILEPYFSSNQLFWFLALSIFSPLYGGSGIIITPDVPLLFFYSLATWAFLKVIESPSIIHSAMLGLSLGLGISSKYMMVLFPICVIPVLALDQKKRKSFETHIEIIFVAAIIGSLPVWVWNYQNDFASFKFQTQHGLGKVKWDFTWPLQYLGAQIGLLFPPIVYWAWKGRRNLPLIFRIMAVLPLAFFFLATFRRYVEANWPIVAYPAVLALAASSIPQSLRVIRYTLWFWAISLITIGIIVFTKPEWSTKLKFREFSQYDRVVEVGGGYEPVFARSYQIAAKMYFELKRPVYKLNGVNRKDQFDFMYESFPKGKLFYMVSEKGDRFPIILKNLGYRIEDRISVDEMHDIWRIEHQESNK